MVVAAKISAQMVQRCRPICSLTDEKLIKLIHLCREVVEGRHGSRIAKIPPGFKCLNSPILGHAKKNAAQVHKR